MDVVESLTRANVSAWEAKTARRLIGAWNASSHQAKLGWIDVDCEPKMIFIVTACVACLYWF